MGYTFRADDVYGLAAKLGAQVREKGRELFFRYCPYCGGDGRDRDTFSVNLENGTFHCFRSSCGKSGHFVEMARDFDYPLDFGDTRRRVWRKIPQRPFPVREPAVAYLEGRGISRAVTERYRVTTVKDNDHILAFPFYDENNVLQFLKYRKTDFDRSRDKSKEWCERDTKPILFGMAQCVDFGRLVITEGQIDSLSAAEAGIDNAVSVPNGCNGFTFLENVWEWIVKFDEVVVFGDCEGGKITLLDTLQKRLPNRVLAVQQADYLGEKDANDILRKYGAAAVRKAVENAKAPPVSHIRELADVQAVDLYTLPRIRTGLPELDRIIGGLFFGQVVLLTGQRGEGKSTFASQLLVEALDQGYSVLAYSGELADYHFKRWMDFQAAGPEHIAVNVDFTGDESYLIPRPVIEKINRWYRGRAYLYDNDAVDDELEEIAASFFCRSPHGHKIRHHVGSALDIAPTLGCTFDLVFIDGDKREYPDYYRMLMGDGGGKALLRSGSILIADNILWSGKVVEPVAHNDRHTQALLQFNRMVLQDERVESVIVPIRDGLNLIRVK